MNKKLIIFGDSAFAEIAKEYFESDTGYKVDAFVVESKYLTKSEMSGIPILPFNEIEAKYPPATHDMFVAVTYTQLNRLRTRIASEAKSKGYKLASYVSPKAFIWKNVLLGEHCFIFEDNTLQPFVKIGNNVVLWSGNHIGHHSVIEDNCFISSHVVISGFCRVGENSFLGVNSTLSNNVELGADNWVGPGVLVTGSTESASLYNLPSINSSKVSSLRFFKIKSD